MNHPEQILRTLDRHLVRPTRLILYGRAALALGFSNPSPEFHATMDVDAILPEIEMSSIEADDSFWNAIEKTNEELHATGLYLTHLFTDAQVILQPDWLENLSAIELNGLSTLELFRPSTADLILTKMMRVDPQDREDIHFLLAQLQPTSATIHHIIENAVVPDLLEIRDAFISNSTWLREQIS